MPDIPSYRRQKLPSTNVGTAPIPLSAADTGEGAIGQGIAALGQGISNLGQSLARIKKMDDQNKDSLAAIEMGNDIKLAEAQYKTKTESDGDTANWPGYQKEAIDSLSDKTYNWGTTQGSSRAALVQSGWSKTFTEISTLGAVSTRNSQNIVATKNAYIQGVAVGDESKEQDYREALGTKFQPDVVDIMVADAKQLGTEAFKKNTTENLKPLLIEVAEVQDKNAAIDVLNKSTKELVDSGVLSKAEGAETNKILGDWLDNYVSGRKKKAKDAARATTTQSYQDLMPMMFDSEVAQLRFGAIEQSKLSATDKKLWNSYIKGSYKDSPTANTPDGFTVASKAAFGANNLTYSKKEAYDLLLNERFINQGITDAQFNWAIEKIENPYEPHVLTDLQTTMASNKDDFNEFFRGKAGDQGASQRVNEGLVAWVDELVRKDKVPLFKFRNELEKQSQKLRWGMDSGYQIGDVVERGGTDWEVVGFDDNGEPLVEEVQ